MQEYQLTVGLFDKDAEEQIISTVCAKQIIDYILIERMGLYAYTMLECEGRYKMLSTGNIVTEPSLIIIICVDNDIDIKLVVNYIKKELNQESVMIKISNQCNIVLA